MRSKKFNLRLGAVEVSPRNGGDAFHRVPLFSETGRSLGRGWNSDESRAGASLPGERLPQFEISRKNCCAPLMGLV